VEKIRTMITARKLVGKITKYTDSRETKRYKCFKWIFPFPYVRHRLLKPIYKTKGWEMKFANDIFNKHSGCCVADAAAFAFLMRECGYGYGDVYVCHDTSHAWTEIKGRVYDPLFAEAKSFKRNYNVSYKTYRLHPVGRRKI
jgi:hypothetical protein